MDCSRRGRRDLVIHAAQCDWRRRRWLERSAEKIRYESPLPHHVHVKPIGFGLDRYNAVACDVDSLVAQCNSSVSCCQQVWKHPSGSDLFSCWFDDADTIGVFDAGVNFD